MNLSFFSFLMSVLFSTVFILGIHLLRNRPFFLRSFGVSTLLLMYGMCLFRMLFVIELPFVIPIGLKGIFSQAYAVMRRAQVPIGSSNVDFLEILICVWAIVAATIFIRLIRQEYVTRAKLAHFRKNKSFVAERVLLKVMKRSRKTIAVKICVCPDIDVPMGLGIFQRWVYLPDEEYGEEELFYILSHEYMHFCNRDGLIKLLILLLRCVFWWNPAVYLLKKDVDQILEIKCDVNVTQDFSKKERLEYLLTIVRTLKGTHQWTDGSAPLMATGLVSRKEHDNIKERFELITKATKQVGWKCQAAFLSFAVVVLAFSYSFVLQSAFDPPAEDIYTNDSVEEFTIDGGYILQHQDGRYSLILANGTSIQINRTALEIYLEEGLKIRKG